MSVMTVYCGSTPGNAWRMASATPDLRLPSHWLVPNYTAWWQRHVC